MRAPTILGLLLLATGCYGSDSIYSPTGASTWNDGYPAAILAVPPGAPTGTLEVASFGFVDLTPADMLPTPTIHVRIVASNATSDRPWNVDIAGATIHTGDGEARTFLANSDLGTLPIALVERGEPRTIDLYFSPPPNVRYEDDLAELDFRIKVAAPARAVPVETHFTRRDAAAEGPGARKGPPVRVAGWGSHWWADPTFPWPGFNRGPGIATPRAPTHAVVNRLPRWQRGPQPWSAQR